MISRQTIQRLVAARQRLARDGAARFLRDTFNRKAGRHKIDPIAHFRFVLDDPQAVSLTPPTQVPPRTVNWIVPPFHPGAGGHTTIFRFVRMLEARGYVCNVVVDDGYFFGSAEHFRVIANDHFFPLKATFFASLDDAPPTEFTIATAWMTAYKIRRTATLHRLYFVQDFEPWFFAVGSEHELAMQSYRLGLVGITAGDWLKHKLQHEFGMAAESIGFSYDREVYKPERREPKTSRNVFFYARPSTSRRAFELGLLALYQLAQRLPDVHITMAGGDLSGYNIPFSHVSEGVVSVKRLAEIYNRCDTALVISLTNLSLLPLELMACGVPIVSNKGPWTQWLLDENNCVLADATPDALCNALHSCLTDPARADAIAERGMRFAQATSWEQEGERFAAILASISEGRGPMVPATPA